MLVLLAALTLLGGCGSDESAGPAASADAPDSPAATAFDSERAFDDLEAQVDIGPRPAGSAGNREQTRLLADRLEEAGVEQVRIDSPLANVVGFIPGSEPGYVVLGAHHDTKEGIPDFVGANDGASGVAVVLELARVLAADPPPGPSYAIALFDGEEARGDREFSEDGKRGSTAYVQTAEDGGAEGIPPINEIRGAVVFDMIGDCDLGVPLEGTSDPGLYELFADADAETFNGSTTPIDDDHVPFLEAGVPAVDLIDFNYGPGATPGEYWHTPEDTLDKVCPESLGKIGEAALRALPRVPEPG